MHKTKESIASLGSIPDSQVRDAREAAIEERVEAIGGETSSEGVGPAFDEGDGDASAFEKKESSGDGPMAGDVIDPPHENPLRPKRKKKGKKAEGVTLPHGRSNHAAAYSTKAI